MSKHAPYPELAHLSVEQLESMRRLMLEKCEEHRVLMVKHRVAAVFAQDAIDHRLKTERGT